MRHDTWAKGLADKHGDKTAHKITGHYAGPAGCHRMKWYQAALAWLVKHRPVQEEQ
jgi:hypothetical protein